MTGTFRRLRRYLQQTFLAMSGRLHFALLLSLISTLCLMLSIPTVTEAAWILWEKRSQKNRPELTVYSPVDTYDSGAECRRALAPVGKETCEFNRSLENFDPEQHYGYGVVCQNEETPFRYTTIMIVLGKKGAPDEESLDWISYSFRCLADSVDARRIWR